MALIWFTFSAETTCAAAGYSCDSKLVAPGIVGSIWLHQLPLMPAGGGGWSKLEEDCWVHIDSRVVQLED